MTSTALDRLVRQGADAGMKAMIERLRVLGVTDGEISANAHNLCGTLKAALKAALPGALDDARLALECGVGAPAHRTFVATMALAGIEVANEEQAWIDAEAAAERAEEAREWADGEAALAELAGNPEAHDDER